MSRLFLPAAIAALAAASCSPQPCTSCASVAGTYTETIEFNSVDCQDGRQIFWGDPASQLPLVDTEVITEEGSTITNTFISGMKGELHTDMSASFGPLASYANPTTTANGSGQGAQGEPGKVYMDGFFTGSPASEFVGSLAFIADIDGCEADTKITWTR